MLTISKLQHFNLSIHIVSLLINNENCDFFSEILIFIYKEVRFVNSKRHILEKNEILTVKIDSIETIDWIPPTIGNQAFDFVLKLK